MIHLWIDERSKFYKADGKAENMDFGIIKT